MLTADLEEKLKTSQSYNEGLIENNAPPKLNDVLNSYIHKRKMKKADIIRMLNVDRIYGYQMLSGVRTPTRNSLIQIALILKLDTDQINYLLRLAGKSSLYVRNVVDARVFYAVKHNMKYSDAVDFIWSESVK